ncbi:MAG: sulfatase [Candidatus Promineifilaceae bacterium]
MEKRPNILLIVSDDHGQWAMGAYGNSELHTPNFDYLAASGVQMENAFTPIPVCSPARASLFTGRLPSQHGLHDYLASGDPEIGARFWLRDEVTLGRLLADAGYQAAYCGKWHMGQDELPQPGFESWFTLGHDYPVDHGGAHRYCDNGRYHVIEGYKTRIITGQALQFLRSRDSERPFFLVAGYTSTHSPWRDHPQRLVDAYRGCSFVDIPRDAAYPFGRQNLESTFPTREDPREALAQYYAAVTQLDEAVGEFLDELDAQGLRQDTLVVYTSDHGLCCGHHGIWGKGNGTLPLNMVEESIRVPLLFNQPGHLFGGQRRAELVDHLDLFQTLAAVAGIDLPGLNYPGRSYMGLLDNSSAYSDWRREQYCEYGPLRMVRTERHKLLLRYPDGRHELFDLEADPRETVNLYREPGYEAIIAGLTAKIEGYFGQYEDERKSGLKAAKLPRHNFSEAWRSEEL